MCAPVLMQLSAHLQKTMGNSFGICTIFLTATNNEYMLQVEGMSKHEAAVGQMQQLASVVDAFPLPEHSAEMELVYSGLRGFLVYEDRKLLYEAYSKVTCSQSSQHAVADALGMLY